MTAIRDATALTSWRKSSYSETATGGCIEISDGFPTGIPVRDSKNPHGPAVIFSPQGWSTFVAAVKRAEFPTT
jgi:hypothetical protein